MLSRQQAILLVCVSSPLTLLYLMPTTQSQCHLAEVQYVTRLEPRLTAVGLTPAQVQAKRLYHEKQMGRQAVSFLWVTPSSARRPI
jgi:hypothetical protein